MPTNVLNGMACNLLISSSHLFLEGTIFDIPLILYDLPRPKIPSPVATIYLLLSFNRVPGFIWSVSLLSTPRASCDIPILGLRRPLAGTLHWMPLTPAWWHRRPLVTVWSPYSGLQRNLLFVEFSHLVSSPFASPWENRSLYLRFPIPLWVSVCLPLGFNI